MRSFAASRKRLGFTLIELMVVVAILSIIGAIAIPFLSHMIKRGYNADALSAGRAIKMAEEIYYEDFKDYSGSILTLKQADRNVDQYPDVIIVFITVTEEGYEFTTRHKKGNETYNWKS
jgi:prepilin-type N-terminal cleavage/methylation domain-containing protein